MVSIRGGLIYIFLILILSFSGFYRVDAYVGLTPAGYSLDFQPNLKQVFNFNFFSDDPEIKFNISVSGDLKQYVELNRDELSGSGNINVLLKLPKKIDKPGVHRIYIEGTQQPKKDQGTLGIVASLRGIIDIRVPYPGKYAEMEFNAENANAGEPINFKLKIYSRGDDGIVTTSYIEIYDFKNKSVATLPIGINEVASTQSIDIVKEWDTKGIAPGRYGARAFVEYSGEKIDSWANFRLGELYVDVVDYKKEFEKGKINPINIDIESFWNDPIENVYGEITILNHESTIPTFSTPSVDLQGFERKTIVGHFDTTTIEENKFKAKVVLHYSGKTTEKIINLRFKREVNYYVIGGIAGGIILLIVIIVLVLWIRKLKKTVKKTKTKWRLDAK